MLVLSVPRLTYEYSPAVGQLIRKVVWRELYIHAEHGDFPEELSGRNNGKLHSVNSYLPVDQKDTMISNKLYL